MDYFPSLTNESGVDSQAVKPESSPVSEVPQLDHDSSTIPSSSPSTMTSEPAGPSQSALNPEASWFDFSGLPGPNDMLFPENGDLPTYNSSYQFGMTINDDTKW